MDRRLASAHVDVVAVEGDVERPEGDLHLGALGDKAAEALGERDAARVDADEGDALEVVRLLDDLVGDAGERPLDRLAVEDDLPGHGVGRAHECTPAEGVPKAPLVMRLLLSGLTGPV